MHLLLAYPGSNFICYLCDIIVLLKQTNVKALKSVIIFLLKTVIYKMLAHIFQNREAL